jgi:hypothetical protein
LVIAESLDFAQVATDFGFDLGLDKEGESQFLSFEVGRGWPLVDTSGWYRSVGGASLTLRVNMIFHQIDWREMAGGQKKWTWSSTRSTGENQRAGRNTTSSIIPLAGLADSGFVALAQGRRGSALAGIPAETVGTSGGESVHVGALRRRGEV